jgi:hypothetical protein
MSTPSGKIQHVNRLKATGTHCSIHGDLSTGMVWVLDRLFRDAEDKLRQTKAWDKAGTALHLVAAAA